MKIFQTKKAPKGFTIPFWLYGMPGLSANAKLLYARLAYMAHEDGYCWISEWQLAGEMNITIKKLQRHIADLKEADLIETRKQVVGYIVRSVYCLKAVEQIDRFNICQR
jgi:DNA-binding MarR family transcriptional regulator